MTIHENAPIPEAGQPKVANHPPGLAKARAARQAREIEKRQIAPRCSRKVRDRLGRLVVCGTRLSQNQAEAEREVWFCSKCQCYPPEYFAGFGWRRQGTRTSQASGHRRPEVSYWCSDCRKTVRPVIRKAEAS